MARWRSLALLLLALLAAWIGSADAATSTTSKKSSTSRTSTASSTAASSTTSEARTTSAAKAAPELSSKASVLSFETVVAALPTTNGTTKLPIPSATPTNFLPITQEMVLSDELAYVLDGSDLNYACWYPISGNYGILPRILFYCTIIAALLLRHHQWLYAGALVASLTYSGTAAIQACLMVWVGRSWGDLDLAAIFTILGTACLLIVPLLNWSDTLRNVGLNENQVLHGPDDCVNDSHGDRREQEFKRAARTILLYWSFLVVLGFLSVFGAELQYFYNEQPISRAWLPIIPNFERSLGPLTCTPPNGIFNYSAGQSDHYDGFLFTAEFVQANKCQDPCALNTVTPTLFRSATDQTTLNLHQLLRSVLYVAETKAEKHNDKFMEVYYGFGVFPFLWIILQGCYAVSFGRRTPAQARNVFYAVLTRLRLSKTRGPLDPAGPWQKVVAKWLALFGYLWAVSIFVVTVPLVVANVIAGEITLFNFAESETPDHVGQWSSWTSVGLAILAALLARFHDDVLYMVSLSFFKFLWLCAHPSWPFIQYWPSRGPDRQENVKVRNIFSGDMEAMPDRKLYRSTAEKAVGEASFRVGEFIVQKSKSSWKGFLDEWHQMLAFMRDPEDSRRLQGRRRRVYIEPCQCAWGCSCSDSQVQGQCRHEDRVCSQGRAQNEECQHRPTCHHERHCEKDRMRHQRLRALNPERRTIGMAFGPIHAGALQLDVTKTPIPFRNTTRPASTLRRTPRYEAADTSESEMDEKLASAGTPAAWQIGRSTRQPSLPDSVKRFFTRRNKDYDQTRPSPVSKPSDESHNTQHSQPMMRDPLMTEQRPSNDRQKIREVVVNEGPVHPLLRDSFVSAESGVPIDTAYRPMRRGQPITQAEQSRRRSMLKSLPDTPKIARTPHPTPNSETLSTGSGVSDVSPVAPASSRDRVPTRGDDISPELPSSQGTLQGSGRITKFTSPVQVHPPSDDEEEWTEDSYDAQRASGGLTTSVERGILSRHRRSQAYGPDIPRDRTTAGLSDLAPIPVHTEEDEDRDEDEDSDDYESAADAERASLRGGSDDGDRRSVAPSESAPPSEVPLQPRMRHIAELVQFLPGPRESSGAFLSPLEKHQLLDPPSGASTPPVPLPPLSPPDPDSNAARAGDLSALNRSPHLSLHSVMFTPTRQSTGSMLAPQRTSDALSSASFSGALLSAASAVNPTSAPRETPGTGSATAQLDGLAGIDAALAATRHSPKPQGYRSTVDYLQVHRPTTMAYADEIVLRKDEFGQYRLVMNGADRIEYGGEDGKEVVKK